VLLDEPFYVPNTGPVFLETFYPLAGDMMFNLFHLRESLYKNWDNEWLMNEYLYHCLFNFYRIYNKEVVTKQQSVNAASSGTRIELFRRLTNAKDYMISNYNRKISIQDICETAFLSETHLHRCFK